MEDYTITAVLNPGLSDTLEGKSPSMVAELLRKEDIDQFIWDKYGALEAPYDQEIDVGNGRYGPLQFDSNAGFGRFTDKEYAGEERDVFAIAYEAENLEGLPAHGLLVTDNHGSYAHVTSEMEEYAGVDMEVTDAIHRLVDEYWDYGRIEEENGLEAFLEEAPYQVELRPPVQKFAEKLDNSMKKHFDSTLRKLATTPTQARRHIRSEADGMHYKHVVNGDTRLMAYVDEERKRVIGWFVGDHEEFDRKDIQSKVERGIISVDAGVKELYS